MDAETTLSFKLAPNGQHLVVTGGEMVGERLVIPAWQEYEGRIYPVMEIGDDAFYDCECLKSVILNGETIIIGSSAFAQCQNLEELHFSPITEIGNRAFLGCRNLKDFDVPINSRYIGSWAFAYCESITSIHLSDGVCELGECVFYKCSKLERINIPYSVHVIGAEAFGRCSSLTSIIIPDSVSYTGKYVFIGCESLRKVFINKPEMLRDTAVPKEAEILQIDAEYFDNDDQETLQEFTIALADNGLEAEKIVELASEYYDRGYRKRGFALYKKAAELGCAKAQRIVADCYRFGFGTNKDGYEAVRWYQKAAEQDDLQSIYALACFYMWGDYGLEKNTDKAVHLWHQAAESGDATAQFSLGNLYLEGLYVEQNREEAIKWFRKSAQQGHKPAREKLIALGLSPTNS